MLSILYVSSATELLSNEELLSLLEQCRHNNAALDITGMLLYKDGNFMQVLEGPDAAVRQIYMRILSDARHTGAIKLLEQSIEERQFASWTMGFKNLDEVTPNEAPGYSDFLDKPLTSPAFQLEPTRAQKLLLMFREKIR